MTEDIKQKLREWADRYETADFIKSDPVQFPRLAAQGLNLSRLTEKEQRRVETVAVITSWLAYGNRKQIIKTAAMLYDLVTEEGFLENQRHFQFNSPNRLYRFFTWADFFDLCERLSLIYGKYGTLESCVLALSENPLDGLIQAFKGVKGFPKDKDSACKRLCMLTRWLVRQDSPVDLGIWTSFDTADLIIPLDTHVHRMAQELGLTRFRYADMRASLEITKALREVFPDDPTKGISLSSATALNIRETTKNNRNNENVCNYLIKDVPEVSSSVRSGDGLWLIIQERS